MPVDAIDRFKKETLRIFGVLEIQLSGKYTGESREYLAGNGKGTYSVAAIGAWRKCSSKRHSCNIADNRRNIGHWI
jgi:glutathione S-transferase